jgi:hypothetical protein
LWLFSWVGVVRVVVVVVGGGGGIPNSHAILCSCAYACKCSPLVAIALIGGIAFYGYRRYHLRPDYDPIIDNNPYDNL